MCEWFKNALKCCQLKHSSESLTYQRDALITRRGPQLLVVLGAWQEHKLGPEYLAIVTQYWAIGSGKDRDKLEHE